MWTTLLDDPPPPLQELYGVRSDLGNLYKALGRLEEAKVGVLAVCVGGALLCR